MPSSPQATIAAILDNAAFRDAVAVLEREHDRTVEDIVTLTEIPSPPFQEEARAAAYLEMLRAHGLEIPYPQRVMHVQVEGAPAATAAMGAGQGGDAGAAPPAAVHQPTA